VEPVSGDFKLTAEQLEAKSAELKKRRADLQTVINANYVANQLRDNEENYRARKRFNMSKFAANNPEKAKASHNNSLNKARINKTYYYKICDLACGKKNDLAKHEKSKSHTRKAAASQSSLELH
jgi:hypothetical protein